MRIHKTLCKHDFRSKTNMDRVDAIKKKKKELQKVTIYSKIQKQAISSFF